MNEPHSALTAGEKETGRLEAFSDGVFSIAMTLLVLEMKVPSLDGHRTPKALLWALAMQWPSYLAFLTSFFTVLVMWVNHHGIFRLIHRTDSNLLLANGFLLMLVTAVPFPTAVLAMFLRTDAASAACAAYGGMFVLISIGFALLLHAAGRRNGYLLRPGSEPEISRRLRDCWLLGTPLYCASALGAAISPWVTMLICGGLLVFWTVGRNSTGSIFRR
jgi:uncharacterized membrane protein